MKYPYNGEFVIINKGYNSIQIDRGEFPSIIRQLKNLFAADIVHPIIWKNDAFLVRRARYFGNIDIRKNISSNNDNGKIELTFEEGCNFVQFAEYLLIPRPTPKMKCVCGECVD